MNIEYRTFLASYCNSKIQMEFLALSTVSVRSCHRLWPLPPPPCVSGYGMVMPPFPPTAYMEPPGYVLPHAQLHPADYRRVLQPPYHQSSAHYQNLTQNPNRRFHLQPNPGYVPKETVSSEVQTEPMVPDVRKGSPAFGNKDPLAGSDSGRGTSSSAHSSPGSSDGKAASYPEEERNSIQIGRAHV